MLFCHPNSGLFVVWNLGWYVGFLVLPKFKELRMQVTSRPGNLSHPLQPWGGTLLTGSHLQEDSPFTGVLPLPTFSSIRWWAMPHSHSSPHWSPVPCWNRPTLCRWTSTCWWMLSARMLPFWSKLFPGAGCWDTVGLGIAGTKGLEDWGAMRCCSGIWLGGVGYKCPPEEQKVIEVRRAGF